MSTTINKNDMKEAAEALIKDGDISPSPFLVCFVCTGNTCRSPMAMAVLNHYGKGRYKAVSAGTAAFPGDEIAENAVLALRRAGIENAPENDYEHHRARKINYGDIVHCDKIMAMSSSHMIQLLSAFPEAAEKISVMPVDIPDPFMGSEAVYDVCLEKITDGIFEAFDIEKS